MTKPQYNPIFMPHIKPPNKPKDEKEKILHPLNFNEKENK